MTYTSAYDFLRLYNLYVLIILRSKNIVLYVRIDKNALYITCAPFASLLLAAFFRIDASN